MENEIGLRFLVSKAKNVNTTTHHEGGKNENLNEKLGELRRWQIEQQNNLLQQQHEQFLQLRQEQENIQKALQRRKNHNCQDEEFSNEEESGNKSSAISVVPSSWNKLVLPHSSPAERMERAAQLRALLREAELKTSTSSDASSEFDGISLLTESNNSGEKIDNSQNLVVNSSPAGKKESKSWKQILKEQSERSKNKENEDDVKEIEVEEPKKQFLNEKPKRTFLRKGQGTARFKGKPTLVKKTTNPTNQCEKKIKINFEPSSREEKTEEKESKINHKIENKLKNNFNSSLKDDDVELKEFEILERASEETSFCSTSSIVVNAMQFRTLQSRFSATENRKSNLPRIREVNETGNQIVREEEGKININTNKQDQIEVESKDVKNNDELSTEEIDFRDDVSWKTVNENSVCASDEESVTSPDLSSSPSSPTRVVSNYFTFAKPISNPNPKETVKTKVGAKLQQDVDANFCALKEKMSELEKEVNKFKRENELLSKLARDQQKSVKQLVLERQKFEMYKDEEEKKLSKWIEEEKKKMKREKGLYEAYLKTRPQFDRQERKKVTELKQQLEDTKSVLKSRELKWNSSQNRLQDRLNSLEEENKFLKEEIQNLEKKNLEQLQQIQKLQQVNHKIKPPDPTLTSQEFSSQFLLTSFTDSSSDYENSHSSGLNDYVYREEPKTTSFHSKSSIGESFCLDRGFSLINDKNSLLKTVENEDGSIEKFHVDGVREIIYSNGTRKEISSDGNTILIFLFNGDIKHVFSDMKIVYYFAENGTTHTTYPDGLQIYHFANDQVEKHFPDGTKEIIFPDKSYKLIYPDGSEENVLTDGTVVETAASGDSVVKFTNGQKEFRTNKFKKRTFPDGTVKFLYPNGHQETRYSNGRLRIKDKTGKLILDQKIK